MTEHRVNSTRHDGQTAALWKECCELRLALGRAEAERDDYKRALAALELTCRNQAAAMRNLVAMVQAPAGF